MQEKVCKHKRTALLNLNAILIRHFMLKYLLDF